MDIETLLPSFFSGTSTTILTLLFYRLRSAEEKIKEFLAQFADINVKVATLTARVEDIARDLTQRT